MGVRPRESNFLRIPYSDGLDWNQKNNWPRETGTKKDAYNEDDTNYNYKRDAEQIIHSQNLQYYKTNYRESPRHIQVVEVLRQSAITLKRSDILPLETLKITKKLSNRNTIHQNMYTKTINR